MPENKRISELTTASQLNENDIVEIAQTNVGSSSGYASFKTTLVAIANKILNSIQYGALTTTAKTIIGAINEAAASGGASSLSGLDDVTLTTPTDGQVLKYDATNQEWVNDDENGGGGGGGNWVDVKGTLTAGQTSITLTNVNILTTSTLDFYTDKFGVNPTNVVVSNGSVTLTFDAQSSDLAVKVRVTNDESLYTFKNYLEVGSTAGPYIDTDLNSTRDSYCEIKFKYNDTPTNNKWFFGAFQSVGIILGYQNGRTEGYLQTGGSLVAYDTNDHIVEIKSDGIYLDSEKKQTGNWSGVPVGVPLYLFSRGGDNPAINNTRIYYCKIWQNGDLVRNLVPAIRKADNEIGMYDRVNEVFYTNSGTGSFTTN